LNYGWADTILRIDLTKNRIVKQRFPKSLGKLFVGGAGVNAKILYDEVKNVIDPFDPENRLIFGTGPLVGTIVPCSNRIELTSVGAFTHAFVDSSAGGYFAPELKWAGYEHIVFQGRASNWVYLWIDNENVELRDATHLLGKDVLETDRTIKEELGDPEIRTAIIGPAGEKLVRYAVPMIDLWRAPGWGGHGAIMGSKNLKAIAVRGTKGVKIAKPGKDLEDACQRFRETCINGPRTPLLRYCGRIHNTESFQLLGASGIKNLQESLIPEDEFWKITTDTVVAEVYDHESANKSCFNCPISCTHRFSVANGPYKGTSGEKIEYTQVQDVKLMGIFDAGFLAKWTFETNRLGLDSSGPANAIAWAMECYERGLLTEEDTDGLGITFGNQEVAWELLESIAHRKAGMGDLLADGSALAAKKIGRGSEKYAMVSKGARLLSDPRVGYGWMLSHAVSTRGADHLKSVPGIELWTFDAEFKKKISSELFGHPDAADAFVPDGKGNLVKWYEDLCGVIDSLGICKTQTAYIALQLPKFEDFAELLSLVTGMSFTVNDLVRVGERINAVERAFNYKFGYTRDDDTLPSRFFEEHGKAHIEVIDKKVFEKMKDDYYAVRGYAKSGLPTRKKWEELELSYVADNLEQSGMLPK
jgi:aldehyde:ferredoxin oxidoreductase